MQLKDKRRNRAIRTALAAATSSLLAPMTGHAQSAADDPRWEIDSTVLYYGEQDGRVEDASIGLRARRESGDGRAFTFGLTTDTLTGATPTGAVPLGVPQTFTRPSANGSYVTPAGKLPLDDSFKDSRVAGNATWTEPLGETWMTDLGVSFSTEYDYVHLGVNGSVSKDLNRNNTTLSAGFAYASDEWDPEGGVPLPLSAMLPVGDRSNKRQATEDKNVLDILLGVSQVINERTIAQINYSYSMSDGYLNDPFKFLTVLDPATGLPVAGPGGLAGLYRFESRPDERTKHGLFGQIKVAFDSGLLATSYRFMTDDWGVDSHTLDARYKFNLNANHYVEPHLRWYRQSEADFYRANLVAGEPLPANASADYRLAELTGITAGVKYGWRMAPEREFSVRLEWYNQSGDAELEGVPAGDDVFPELDALILQVSYRFEF